MFVNDVTSTVTTPVRALKGFDKIRLEPLEKRQICFILGRDELALIDRSFKEVVEPGIFRISIGGLEKDLKVL